MSTYTSHVELKSVLAAVPGLQRQFVYYLESQGYIAPERLPRARIAHRDYSSDDLRVVRDMWRYYQEGFSLQAARQLSTRAQESLVYVAFAAERSSWPALFAALQSSDVVAEVSVLYGAEFHFLVALHVPDE